MSFQKNKNQQRAKLHSGLNSLSLKETWFACNLNSTTTSQFNLSAFKIQLAFHERKKSYPKGTFI